MLRRVGGGQQGVQVVVCIVKGAVATWWLPDGMVSRTLAAACDGL